MTDNSYYRQNSTRKDFAELLDTLNLPHEIPPHRRGLGRGWPEFYLCTKIPDEKYGVEVGNNLRIGDVVWMLTPPSKGSPLGVIVDVGRKGFVCIRNSNSDKPYDYERKPEHLLYNDRFQTKLDNDGRAHSWDPRHYMHTLALNHIHQQNARIAELEERCTTLQDTLSYMGVVNNTFKEALLQSDTLITDLRNQRNKAKRTLKTLKRAIINHNNEVRNGQPNTTQPSTHHSDISAGFHRMTYPTAHHDMLRAAGLHYAERSNTNIASVPFAILEASRELANDTSADALSRVQHAPPSADSDDSQLN